MASQVESIKWIAGTNFMVDGFRFARPAKQPGATYFLTHYHGDHYCGLPRHFPGVIYASEITCDLLVQDYRLKLRSPDHPEGATLVRMPLGQRFVIDGAAVTALPANHCPGAVMLLFEVPKAGGGTRVILHTGDCRLVLVVAGDIGIRLAVEPRCKLGQPAFDYSHHPTTSHHRPIKFHANQVAKLDQGHHGAVHHAGGRADARYHVLLAAPHLPAPRGGHWADDSGGGAAAASGPVWLVGQLVGSCSAVYR
jgi:hypothetical protein